MDSKIEKLNKLKNKANSESLKNEIQNRINVIKEDKVVEK